MTCQVCVVGRLDKVVGQRLGHVLTLGQSVLHDDRGLRSQQEEQETFRRNEACRGHRGEIIRPGGYGGGGIIPPASPLLELVVWGSYLSIRALIWSWRRRGKSSSFSLGSRCFSFRNLVKISFVMVGFVELWRKTERAVTITSSLPPPEARPGSSLHDLEKCDWLKLMWEQEQLWISRHVFIAFNILDINNN